MITIAMMARVILGHTGRNVYNPPKALFWIFLLMVLAFLFRVIMPLMDNGHYTFWIGFSQIAWVGSFMIFIVLYTPMLFKQRVDGKFG